MILETIGQFLILIKLKYMKSHKRNISLLQEAPNNHHQHHRSFSYTRYHKNYSNQHANYLSPNPYPTDHFTLPLSTQFNREPKYRKKPIQKQVQATIVRTAKGQKSKQKQSIERKKKELKPQKKDKRQKRSAERQEKYLKRDSRDKLKQKNHTQKQKPEISCEKNHSKSNQMKGDPYKNMKKEKTNQKQRKRGKRKMINFQESEGLNWQQIIIEYGDYLSVEEIGEIKEYKWIYFLGKIKQRTEREHIMNGRSGCLAENGLTEKESFEKKLNLIGAISQDRPKSSSDIQSIAFNNQDEFYKYEIGDHIAYRYEIIESINEGSFGQVIKVYDHKSKQFLALKITKKAPDLVQQTFVQITILTHIKQKDKSNLSGIVRIKDFTIFRNNVCIVFELLDGNLYQLLAFNKYNGLNQEVVRFFALQILSSLNFLQKENIIHCDIKPENIVMKKWGKSGVKLVDFGTSCFEGKQTFEYLQSRYYRAPQVMLKQKYSFPIDMWSFGCLIAQLKIGEPIFAGTSNLEQLMYISNSIGLPNAQDGPYSQQFLKKKEFQDIIKLDYLGQYKKIIGKGQLITKHPVFSNCKYIKTCMKTLRERLMQSKGLNHRDNKLQDFLKKILVWQPQKRLKPEQALQDPWITQGLPSQIKQLYTIVNSTQYKQKRSQKSNEVKSNSKPKKNKNTSKKNSKQEQLQLKKNRYSEQLRQKMSNHQSK